MTWTWLWIGWFIYFAVVEGAALYSSYKRRKNDPLHRGGTLSEHVWMWFGTDEGVRANVWGWLRRGALGLFLLWLTVHFMSGGQIV